MLRLCLLVRKGWMQVQPWGSSKADHLFSAERSSGGTADRGLEKSMNQEPNTETAQAVQTGGDQAVVQKRLVSRLRMHVRDMDARITMAQVEIREKQAAVGQLEKEKWALDREVDKIEELLSANTLL